VPSAFPTGALDDRIAISGTTGSGKTFTLQRICRAATRDGARVAMVDPLRVWWGLRAAQMTATPVSRCRVRRASCRRAITAEMGAALGQLILWPAMQVEFNASYTTKLLSLAKMVVN
jgi:Cdc6-like AAA superfamily ATPase